MVTEYRPRTRDKRSDRRAKRPMKVSGRGVITVLTALDQKRERARRAGVAQLEEHRPPNPKVAGSSPVSRAKTANNTRR